MREQATALRITCNRCGVETSVVHADTQGTFITTEITAHEVWFSGPGDRGGFQWTDDDGTLNETRSTIYDSCGKCADEAMRLIDQFYKPSETPA